MEVEVEKEQGPVKALVADDSKTMRRVMIAALSHAGITDVVEAADGWEAVAAVKAEQFDIIVMDWYMPNMLGIDAVRAIRAENRGMPIIMVTVEADRNQVVEALKAGVTDYLIKPVSPTVLTARIREALGNASSE